MTYYVNLGGIIIYGVTSVEDSGEREITAYDGIGQGFFPVPESRKLRTWTIECEMTEKNLNGLPNWSAASKVFTAFEVLLATKDPSRFIFVSDNRNESMSGYLAGYSKKEKHPGVYDVTIRVTEYIAAGVKTTGVPYIKRPGKAPAVPKTVVFNSRTTPYSLSQKNKKSGSSTGNSSRALAADFHILDSQTRQANAKAADFHILESKTGKPVTNAALVKDLHPYTESFLSPQKPKEEASTNIKKAFSAIGSAINAFVKGVTTKGAIGGNN